MEFCKSDRLIGHVRAEATMSGTRYSPQGDSLGIILSIPNLAGSVISNAKPLATRTSISPKEPAAGTSNDDVDADGDSDAALTV